ncbi:MAG: hypothetical protein AB1599_10800, partial [Planctomycetota bacterium]
QKFTDAWIHIGQIFESAGANNVMFVMTLDPFEPGGADWSEVTAIPSAYLDVVELDGYTDPVLRKNANLSSNELFTKKLTEIAWQLELVYPDAATRPSMAIGEFAFSGDAAAGRPKDQVYNWFIHDLIHGAYPFLTRFSILNTYLAGPRPQANALNYSPSQEGFWSAIWQPESPWYNDLLVELGNSVGFWQHPRLVPAPYSIYIPVALRLSPSLNVLSDYSSPRQNRTANEVNDRFAALAAVDFAGFNPVRNTDGSWLSPEIEAAINEVSAYYLQNNPQQLVLLNSLIESGKLRAGPDDTLTFYGANNNDTYLIATNNNPDIASAIIHELNGLSHEENLAAEQAFAAQSIHHEFNPTEPAYFASNNIFRSLNGVTVNSLVLVRDGGMRYSGVTPEIVNDEHIGSGSWVKADFTAAGQHFSIHHETATLTPYDVFDSNWQEYANNPTAYALRFLTLGAGNTYSIVLIDDAGRQLSFPIGGSGGLIGANSWKNQVATADFNWLKSKAPAGFNWSNIYDFRIRADQSGMMLISDIQIVHLNSNYDIAMGVAGHDLQNDPQENQENWRQRLDNINYFGQPASIYTYFTTIFEPIEEVAGMPAHYSDIVARAKALTAV